MAIPYDEDNSPRVLDTLSRATQPIANLAIPLDIPTPDGTPAAGAVYKSVNHPDVALIPEGLFGYRYWMAFMPYPDESRETACIVASNNGVDWELPAGMTNPVETNAAMAARTGWAGSVWHGDVDLVYHASVGVLALYTTCYGSSGTNWQLTRHTLNVDGRSWSAPAVVLSGAGSNDLISPAVVVEDDGSCTMFYRKGSTQPGAIHYRTSTDHGVTWSAESAAITLPKMYYKFTADPAGTELPTVWHLDVVRVAERYHLLGLAQNSAEYNSDNSLRHGSLLYYWTGHVHDKLTGWKLESSDRAIFGAGYDADWLQCYRSCLVPIPGDPDRFDIYVAAIPRGYTVSAHFPLSPVTFNAGTDIFDFGAAHFYNNNDPVVLNGAIPPAGIAFGTKWVVNRTDQTLQLAATRGGAAELGTTAGTNLSISRQPWKIVLFKNVRLPMEPKVLNALIVPPASTISVAPAVWFAANWAIFNRFHVDRLTAVRYVRFHVAVQSGNIEVGIGKLAGVDRDYYYPIADSGEVACPAAGAARIDLGLVKLPAGDYAVYLKASDTIFQTTFGQSQSWVRDARLTGVVNGGLGAAMPKIGVAFSAVNGHRWVAGLVLEGDYV